MTSPSNPTPRQCASQAARSRTLNAADLTITAATLDGRPVRMTTNAADQQITVTAPVTPGRHTMTFAWTGIINRSAAGLFAID